VTAVIHGLVHACVLLLPALLGDVQRAFRVTLLEVAAGANLMYLAFGAAALPGGYLADRFGSRRMLALSSLGCGLAAALVALAPTFALFTVGLGLLGLCAGLHHPSGLSLLSRGVAGGSRGRAIGIHGLGGSLGEAVAPAAAALAARFFGWRYGFGAAALLALLCSVLVLVLVDGGRAATPAAAVRGARPWESTRQAVVGIWRSVPLRWLLLSAVASGFVYRGVLTFLPLHLGEERGSPLSGATLISFVLLAGMLAQVLGGNLADRLPRERLFLAEVMLFAPVLLLLGVGSGLGVVALALCFGFLWYLAQPLANTLVAAHAGAPHHGLLYGIQFALAFGLGSFATTLGGYLTSLGGTRLAFLGFGAFGVLQLIAAIGLVRSTTPRDAARSSASPDRSFQRPVAR
jgi:MFS family permease